MSAAPPGSVAHTLAAMTGVWHDRVEIFAPDGRPMAVDERAGTPGPAPFDNLVYVDFDGERYQQTNVTFRGRPLHVRSFRGRLREGVLVFDRLGPDDPEHVGISAGVEAIAFVARRITDAWQRYAEPDVIHLHGRTERTRVTVLYRGGELVRSLRARGVRLAPLADRRLAWDPRGAEGPVHQLPADTEVFRA